MENNEIKYLVIYTKNGILHTYTCGDDITINHYIDKNFVVAIYDDAKLAIEAIKAYSREMNNQWV